VSTSNTVLFKLGRLETGQEYSRACLRKTGIKLEPAQSPRCKPGFLTQEGQVDLRSPRIAAIGVANPPRRFSQEEAFQMAGYTSPRILEIFRNCDIDFRHFYVAPGQGRNESPDQMNRRYLSGALDTGSCAAAACMQAAQIKVTDIDLLLVCTSTGYVCPDLGSRLIAQMGFRPDVQRALTVGLGCAGALPTLQRACDFVRAYPNRTALMLAVEICSACYFVDDSMDTKVGNAICADGAAAFLITDGPEKPGLSPAVMDFESCINSEHIDKVGFEHRDGKLRIILANTVRDLAGPLLERALDALLRRNLLKSADIRFWIAHPGGRKVIDNIQMHLGLTDEQLCPSRAVMRNFGNMSSPTVMFVLDEIIRSSHPQPGDWGVMLALGPGLAAEAALLRW
jgi:3,5-dihydroxyphenylacetyl-CoA synthase